MSQYLQSTAMKVISGPEILLNSVNHFTFHSVTSTYYYIIFLFDSIILDTFGRDKLKSVLVMLLGDHSDKYNHRKMSEPASKTIWAFMFLRLKSLDL